MIITPETMNLFLKLSYHLFQFFYICQLFYDDVEAINSDDIVFNTTEESSWSSTIFVIPEESVANFVSFICKKTRLKLKQT